MNTIDSRLKDHGLLHLKNEGSHDWLDISGQIVIPILTGVVIAGLGIGLGFLIDAQGTKIESQQRVQEEIQRHVDRAAHASSNRQAVLSQSVERLTDMGAEKDLINNQKMRKAIRAEIIVAFKQLDDSMGSEGHGEIQVIRERVKSIIDQNSANVGEHGEDALLDLEGFDDAGQLKGTLVRSLYESQLINSASYSQLFSFPAATPDSLVSGADMRRIVLENQSLPNIDLRGAYLERGNLRGADLQNAHLEEADFQFAALINANLRSVNAGQFQQFEGFWDTPSIQKPANFSNANFTGADLRNADLSGADLRGANFTNADLRGATLPSNSDFVNGAILTGACFSHSFDILDAPTNTRGLDALSLSTINSMRKVDPTRPEVCRDMS